MLLRLLVFFIVVPVLDLWLLIKLGKTIGTWPAIIVILSTGVLGAGLVKLQGFALFNKIRWELIQGRMPTQELISGLGVLLGAILLIAPGIITDLVGLLLLFPPTRLWITTILGRWAWNKLGFGNFIKPLARDKESVDDDEF